MTTLFWRITLSLMVVVPSDAGANTHAMDTTIIVCFGNSTTAVRKGLSKPYPERLAERYFAHHIPVKIFNAGKGGNHSGSTGDNSFHKGPHAKERFIPEVVKRSPHLMIICFGINDAWQDEGKSGPSRISPADYRRNLLEFQRALSVQGGETIFLGPNPLGGQYPSFRMQRLRRYHRITRRVARKTHSKWIDTFHLFRNSAGSTVTDVDHLLMDGMHPNDRGHEIITEAIWQKISQKHQIPTP